jgi:signal peptidase I
MENMDNTDNDTLKQEQAVTLTEKAATDEPGTPEASDPKVKGSGWKAIVREYAEAIITAIVLALIIRAFVVQAFKIPSGSMLETLQIGDHLLVNKFIYGLDLPFTDKKIFGLNDPEKGDIVVFKYPEDPRRDFIKRVVAVGGDTIQGKNKTIFINDNPVEEPFTIHTDDRMLPADVSKRDNFGPTLVPEGKVFVMGDNRENSHDSRYWGFVDIEAIRGKAFIIYWSQDGNILNPRWGRIGDILH